MKPHVARKTPYLKAKEFVVSFTLLRCAVCVVCSVWGVCCVLCNVLGTLVCCSFYLYFVYAFSSALPRGCAGAKKVVVVFDVVVRAPPSRWLPSPEP